MIIVKVRKQGMAGVLRRDSIGQYNRDEPDSSLDGPWKRLEDDLGYGGRG